MSSEPGPGFSAWSDAVMAARLFAVDPAGLGGVTVRSRPGPARDAWIATVRTLLPLEAPFGRAPLGVGDDRLLGGLDLTASLAAGRPVVERGLLAALDGGVVVLPMAERMDEGTAARIAAVLDAGEVLIERDGLTARLPASLGLTLLDEGDEPAERPPPSLSERLAFQIDLHGVRASSTGDEGIGRKAVADARRRLGSIETTPDPLIEALCAAAAAFGLASIRPPLLAVRAARAHAALSGRNVVISEDAAIAARLVLVPRALSMPAEALAEEPEQPSAEPEPADAAPRESERDAETSNAPAADAERVVAAVHASLPAGLLEGVVGYNLRTARTPRRRGAGAAAKSALRGRPVGSRPGALRPGERLNLVETLRAAAPWQGLRSAGKQQTRLLIQTSDFRIRRFVQQRESTTVILVDASGSAAFQRLGEAKGAVELLLARAYVTRARVALIAFRGKGAEVLLAPTRSLTRAKRSLADLAGGGGTPLASGLDSALALALAERSKDRTPLLVVLTDGRANIARDGAPGRAGAERDAMVSAARVREAGIGAAFVDTAARPGLGADRFARAMGAVYAPLPYADAGAMSGLVEALRSARPS